MFNFLKIFFSRWLRKEKEPKNSLIQQINIGDIIFAKLPLSDKQLAKIDPDHIKRPFIVVKKNEDTLITYQFSSVKKDFFHEYDFYKQSFLFNDNSKPSYIYLYKTIELPIENVITIKKPMNEHILMRLDKRIYLANRNGKNLPRFYTSLVAEKGDIIYMDGQMYLIITQVEDHYIVNKIERKPSQQQQTYKIKNSNNKTYYIHYMKDIPLFIDTSYSVIDMLSYGQLKHIRYRANKYKERHDQYYFTYPIGHTFYVGMNNFLYLYNKGKYCYGIQYEEEDYYLNIIRLENIPLLRSGPRLEVDQVKRIMEHILLENHDVHRVIRKILPTLETSSTKIH